MRIVVCLRHALRARSYNPAHCDLEFQATTAILQIILAIDRKLRFCDPYELDDPFVGTLLLV